MKPFNILLKDTNGKLVEQFINIGDPTVHVDTNTLSEFVCKMYTQRNTKDVNEARYLKVIEMTGKINKVSKIKN